MAMPMGPPGGTHRGGSRLGEQARGASQVWGQIWCHRGLLPAPLAITPSSVSGRWMLAPWSDGGTHTHSGHKVPGTQLAFGKPELAPPPHSCSSSAKASSSELSQGILSDPPPSPGTVDKGRVTLCGASWALMELSSVPSSTCWMPGAPQS